MLQQSVSVLSSLHSLFTPSFAVPSALLVYVTCTTFNREVRHVWKRPPSIVSGIFILDKYTALVFYPVAAAKYFVRDDAVSVSW